MQTRVDWVLIIFGTQVIKKKRPVLPVFPDYLSDYLTVQHAGPYEVFLWSGEKLSKNFDHHGWLTTKNLRKHWLKTPLKQSPEKRNLVQNINNSKISYFEFFFWTFNFGNTKFLYLSRRSNGYHKIFF